jgi:hypothetical protein
VKSRDELLTRATRLHNELLALKRSAAEMAPSDMRRWQLSLRVLSIRRQLEIIHAEHEGVARA